MIRAALWLSTYLSGVWLFLFMVCVMPGRALALVSPQAYARVVAEAEWIASVAAERGAMASAVGTAVAGESAASVAFRAVAGPIGWAALGVSVGLALYEMYYNRQDAAALKEASRQPGSTTVNGQTVTNAVKGTAGLTLPVIPDQYAWVLGATGMSQALAIIAGAMVTRFTLQTIPFVRWGS
jgi:hypothetical protein